MFVRKLGVLAAIMAMAGLSIISAAQTVNTVPKYDGTKYVDSSLVDNNGNIGIGTANPTAGLDVNQGKSEEISTSAVPNGNLFIGSPQTQGVLTMGVNTGSYAWIQYTNRMNASSHYPLVLNPNGGNVGVGTTSPAAGLDINQGNSEDINTSGVPNGNLFVGSPQTSGVLTLGVNTGNYAWIQYTDRANANSRYPLVLNPNGGNVGLGTKSPNAKLDVRNGDATNSAILYHTGGAASYAEGADQVEIRNDDTSTAYNLLHVDVGNVPARSFVFNSSGNMGVGVPSPSAKLEVAGNVKLSNGGGVTFSDGTAQTTAWTGVLCGGDYAESVDVTGERKKYEPGDVLVLDQEHPGSFVKSAEPYSTSVSGIYSTKPGVVGRRSTDATKQPDEVPMAMVGIVPTKVSAENGPIRTGDLLVTSATAGYAMKGTDRSRMPGAVMGKAMGRLDEGTGIIEVLVTLQ